MLYFMELYQTGRKLVRTHDILTVVLAVIFSAQAYSRNGRIYLPELNITGNLVGLDLVKIFQICIG